MDEFHFEDLGTDEEFGWRAFRVHNSHFWKSWTMLVTETGEVFARLDDAPSGFLPVLVGSDMSGGWLVDSLAEGNRAVGIVAAHASADIEPWLELHKQHHLLPPSSKKTPARSRTRR